MLVLCQRFETKTEQKVAHAARKHSHTVQINDKSENTDTESEVRKVIEITDDDGDIFDLEEREV